MAKAGQTNQMNILFLSSWFPFPPDNGSKLRVHNLLRGLASQHEVTLLSFADQEDVRMDMPEARAVCREVAAVPWKAFSPNSQRARRALFSVTPRSIADTFSNEMQQRVQEVIESKTVDLIIASQLSAAAYAPSFRGIPALFEEAEAGLLYEQFAHARLPWHRVRYGLTWVKQKYYLASLMSYFRGCTVVSEKERMLLRSCAPGFREIEVIPNCVQLSEYAKMSAPVRAGTMVFTGSFRYQVNHEAMVWFLSQIYPRICDRVPNVQMTITGDHSNLPLPSAKNVYLTGSVADVRPLIASAWLAVAPIRRGGGTRLKILEAMSLRTPVVATSKGAEGLDVQHDEHLLIADTPEHFADQVVRLLKDPALRERLTENAYRLVSEKYDWGIVLPHFLHLVDKVARA